MAKVKEVNNLNRISNSSLLIANAIEIDKLKAEIQKLQDTIESNLNLEKSIKIEKANKQLVLENKKLRDELCTPHDLAFVIAFCKHYLFKYEGISIKTSSIIRRFNNYIKEKGND